MIGVVLGTGWRDQIVPDFSMNDMAHTGTAQTGDGWWLIERWHLYEGATAEQAVRGIRAAFGYGVRTLVLTNASGAVNPTFQTGEVYTISDHLNLTGQCPEVGFQTLADIYTKAPGFRPGVFAQVAGPAFETPAEAKMLRLLGADMVGMSTAIEAVCAASLGMKVVGLSLVTDTAGSSDGHKEVLRAASEVDLGSVLARVLEKV